VAHILFYDYVENIGELRAPHREAHLARINEWRDAGKLLADLVSACRVEPLALV